MDLQHIQTLDSRRSALWFLLYDDDYKLSEPMLHQCFVAHGKRLSSDQLKTHSQWLCEQGLTKADVIGGISYLTLTDRGAEVARGFVNAVGVRNLRPSEIAEINQFKGY